MSEKTDAVVLTLEALKSELKEAKTLEQALSKVDGFLLVAKTTKEVEQRDSEMSKTEMKTKLGLDPNEMVSVEISLYKPFIDFLKEYMAFFGVKKTIEDICRNIIYERVNYLYLELGQYIDQHEHLLDSREWDAKHPHLSITSMKDEGEADE